MTIQQAIAAAVTTLSETYRQPLTQAAARGYTIGLEDLTQEQLAVATKRAIREAKFMPTPAELRAFVGLGGPRALEAAGIEAWEAVRKAMDDHDYTASVDFGPLANAVVRNLGGWRWLCGQKLTSMPFIRKDFERVYGLLAAAPVEGLHGEPLPGSMGGVPVRIRIGKGPQVERPALAAREDESAADVRRLVGGMLERRS